MASSKVSKRSENIASGTKGMPLPKANTRFSDTPDRTEASRTVVGEGLFYLGLRIHDKGTTRDHRLMQRTTGINLAANV